MARSLIDSMTDHWDPDSYKDDYREAVEDMIEEKIARGGKSAPAAPARKKPGNVIDLMKVLQQSLAAQPAKQPKASKTAAEPKPAKKSSAKKRA